MLVNKLFVDRFSLLLKLPVLPSASDLDSVGINSLDDFITIVSGLPRSGTSMMMKMLVAGGLEPLTDNIRTADEDNPEGYFEFERVKQLKDDQAWLQDARGKCVKVVSAFLKHLPPELSYRIIFMRRNIEEVLASQRQMLVRRGEATDTISDEKITQAFERHLKDLEPWLTAQLNITLLNINYTEVITNPLPNIQNLKDFLQLELDTERMAGVVNKNLYRNRASVSGIL